jgi:hypothetical protein
MPKQARKPRKNIQESFSFITKRAKIRRHLAYTRAISFQKEMTSFRHLVCVK